MVLFFAACGIETMLLVLFANKIRQTSEWALRYSQQRQEEVGQWTIALVIVGLSALVFLFLMLVARSHRISSQKNYTDALCIELGRARKEGRTPEQVECESELRRLGA